MYYIQCVYSCSFDYGISLLVGQNKFLSKSTNRVAAHFKNHIKCADLSSMICKSKIYIGSDSFFKNPYVNLIAALKSVCPNVSTAPIMAMGCRQCLPLSVVQLKG